MDGYLLVCLGNFFVIKRLYPLNNTANFGLPDFGFFPDSDLTKLSDWLLLNSHFDNQPPKHLLMNIASWLVADDKTICDNAKDVGEQFLSSITGCSFGEVKLQRKKSYTISCPLTTHR